MNRYRVFRKDILKFIVITTVCAILASCGANNPATMVSPATAVPSATAVPATSVPSTEVPATAVPPTAVPVTEVKTGEIVIPGDRFFPEGVAAAADGTFYAGSLEEGSIARSLPGSTQMEPFIQAGANGLVSVLGLYVDDARNTLWACSADAGNGKLKGTAPVAIKAFDLKTGEAKGSYDLPGGGFPNDLTVDAQGNVYVTDSWSPRILRLAAGGTQLEEWVKDPQLGAEQWSLNGIDFDAASNVIYTVNQKAGLLFRIEIKADGSVGAVTQIKTSQELRRPDGLKVIGIDTLATGEGGAGGMAVITVQGDKATVRRLPAGLDGVATFAFYKGSAWLVENHADHFWDPTNAGPDAKAPFRIVEVPLNPSAIVIPGDRFFPEGVAAAADGTFFAGSLEEGSIMRTLPGATAFEPFIQAGANGLVSVLGLYVDDAHNILWACSADAGNGKLKGIAPVAIKAFDLKTGEAKGSYDLPGGGFPNDLTVDAQGNVYVTDSWSPRILRLAAGGTQLEEWVKDPQLGAEQWSLNGIDFDAASNVIYTVNQRAGLLFRIAIKEDGSAGAVTQIKTSQELRRPDGLKVIGLDTLATGEGGAGGMAVITVQGDKATVRRLPAGLDGVATFAFYKGSAWLVENHADHFWDPTNAGPDAKEPFRIVEVPLD